jgi:hypothetical protein
MTQTSMYPDLSDLYTPGNEVLKTTGNDDNRPTAPEMNNSPPELKCRVCSGLIVSGMCHLVYGCGCASHAKCMTANTIVRIKIDKSDLCNTCYIEDKKEIKKVDTKPELEIQRCKKIFSKEYIKELNNDQKRALLNSVGMSTFLKPMGNFNPDYQYFLDKNVTFSTLAKFKISFSQLFHACQVDDYNKLCSIGFKKIYFKQNKETYTMEEFLSVYQVSSFSTFSSLFNISMEEFFRLKPSAPVCWKLNLTCEDLMKKYKIEKKYLKKLNYTPSEWVNLLNMNQDFLFSFNMNSSDVKSTLKLDPSLLLKLLSSDISTHDSLLELQQ